MQKIIEFFNRLEDKIKGKLSHFPVLYALIGGIGIILFWRGIWHLADDVSLGSIISTIIGAVILILTGVFVSTFIGSRLILSGLIGEKRLTKKEESELETEETKLKNLQSTLKRVEEKLDHIDKEVEEK